MANVRRIIEEGFAHHAAGRFDEAEAVYKRGLTSAPNDSDLLYLLGTIEFQTGRLPAARERLQLAERVRPGHPETLNNLGLVLRGQGRFEEAAECFRRSLELCPSDEAVREALNDVETAQELSNPRG